MDNGMFKLMSKDKWIINLSGTHIPDDVLHIASLGKKFGVPYMKKEEIPFAKIIADIELKLDSMEEEEKIKARSSYMHAINCYVRRRRQLDNRALKYKLKNAKKFIKTNRDILFLKADKGNMTVVVTKNFYLDKMMTILSDETTYKILKYNPTKILKYEVNQLLKSWNEHSFIDKSTKHHLSGMDGNIARAYGSPKIHKPDTPFRIIVSFINSPTYKLAKYLQKILNRSLNLEFNQPRGSKVFTKNSRSLMENIRQLQLPEEFIIISMDVVSLFTNIPLKLVVKGIENRWNIIKHYTEIPMEQFIKAIKLCFNSSAFVFNGVFYQQVYGAAMGSPLSPIVAEIVMQDLENFCLGKLDFPVYFYTRYVDDILVFLPPNEVEKILDVFNKYHDRLKFTIEREVDRKINFLELTLIRSSNKIEFDWYQKPTATGRYLNYHSHHPKYQKLGIIKALIDKAVLLCDQRFRNKNLATIRQSLFNNGYPKRLVKDQIQYRVPFLLFKNTQVVDENNNNSFFTNLNDMKGIKSTFSLPYVSKLSEHLKFVLKKLNIHVTFSNCNNLSWMFTGHKDSLSVMDISHVVYCIPCCECKFVFIGHTKYQLGICLQNHRTSLNNPHLEHLATALTEHAFCCFHYFNFKKTKILAVEPSYKRRQILTEIYSKLYNVDIGKIIIGESINLF